MVTIIHARTRDSKQTASQLEATRGSGNVPAVVYGKQIGNVSISVPEKEISSLLQSASSQIIQLQIDGGDTIPTMIQQVQRDTLNRSLLHIDFHQIEMNAQVEAAVPLQFIGEPAGVKEEGGLLQIQLHSIVVRCLPADIPQRIELDISQLHAGEHLKAEDIVLPEGLELQEEGSEIVATILTVQKLAEEETEAVDEAKDEEPAAKTEPING